MALNSFRLSGRPGDNEQQASTLKNLTEQGDKSLVIPVLISRGVPDLCVELLSRLVPQEETTQVRGQSISLAHKNELDNILVCLQNISTLSWENSAGRQAVIQAGALPPLLQCIRFSWIDSHLYFGCYVLWSLAGENQQLFLDSGAIPCLTRCLCLPPDKTMKTLPEVRVKAAGALGNLAFDCDNGSVGISEIEGCLPALIQMLHPVFDKTKESAPHEEPQQCTAAGALWSLSFHPKAAKRITDAGGIEALEELRKKIQRRRAGYLTALRKFVDGALFELMKEEKLRKQQKEEKEEDHDESDDGGGKKKEHKKPQVMISYNWSSQDLVKNLYQNFVIAGLDVWLDIEQMSGSTLEAMAQAVEDSDVVCVVLSEKYKQSQACRTEAEYAYSLRKPIVPVKVQKDWHPTGWLGALLGTKLYFELCELDLSNPKNLEPLLQEMQRQVQSSSFLPPPSSSLSPSSSSSSSSPSSSSPSFPSSSSLSSSCPSSSTPSSPFPSPASCSSSTSIIVERNPSPHHSLLQTAAKWTQSEFLNWLESKGFETIKWENHGIDGRGLSRFRELQLIADGNTLASSAARQTLQDYFQLLGLSVGEQLAFSWELGQL